MKKCSVCQIESELAHRSSRCKPCHRQYMKNHYQANKQYYIDKAKIRNQQVVKENRTKLVQYLRLNGCCDCGTEDIEVLDFDHEDATEKSFSIANMMDGTSWSKIEQEIQKCVIRCANCHRKRTRRQFGYWLASDYPVV